MEIENLFDLKILNIEGEEDCKDINAKIKEFDIDLVNIFNPNLMLIKELSKQGFFYKPFKITYVLQIPKDKDAYLSSLSKNNKRQFTRAFKKFEAENLEVTKQTKVNKNDFLDWLEVYNSNISKKEKGLTHVDREWYTKNKDKIVAIFVRKDRKMIGGVILKKKEKRMSISFLFSRPEFFNIGINRVLSIEAVIFAKELNYKEIEMGMDRNIYGHYLSSGLFLFKKSMGFKVEAKENQGRVLTKIFNFSKFKDIIFFVSYLDGQGLVGNLIFNKQVSEEEINKEKEYFESNLLSKLEIFRVKDNKLIKIS